MRPRLTRRGSATGWSGACYTVRVLPAGDATPRDAPRAPCQPPIGARRMAGARVAATPSAPRRRRTPRPRCVWRTGAGIGALSRSARATCAGLACHALPTEDPNANRCSPQPPSPCVVMEPHGIDVGCVGVSRLSSRLLVTLTRVGGAPCNNNQAAIKMCQFPDCETVAKANG
jgi:hypothetical protein